MFRNLKKINLDVYKSCYNAWLVGTAGLRTAAPDFLEIACIQNVVVSYHNLIVYINNIQCDDDIEEDFIEKNKFFECTEIIGQSLDVIKQISIFTEDKELFTEGVKINEFGQFMEVMSCFDDLLCKMTGGSKKAHDLIHEYWSKKTKENDDLEVLWEKLENLEELDYFDEKF